MTTSSFMRTGLTFLTRAADAKSEKYMDFDGFDDIVENEEDMIQPAD
jgi:hypothetical protein